MGAPTVSFVDTWWFLWDMLKVDSCLVLQNLDLIKQWKLDKYEFGYDITIYIYENNRSYIWRVDTWDEIDVDFMDVYDLMKDWKNYLDACEKENREGEEVIKNHY